MSVFSSSPAEPNKSSRNLSRKKSRPSIRFESLEDRSVPTCNIISGFVYQDANNNGLMDAGETPIANSSIELRNDQNVVVATATTDANGFYQFEHDATIVPTITTLTKKVTFNETQTDFSANGELEKFNPDLGELESIEVTLSGFITSEIKVENTSQPSNSTISGQVAGTINLTAGGLSQSLELSEYAGSFQADKFDGSIDFAGASGKSFGVKTANGEKKITLTGADMDAFIGTDKANVAVEALATSRALAGGNVLAEIRSTAGAEVTVVYKYKSSDCLRPGNYTIIQTKQPDGFLDGKESSEGQVLNTPPGSDVISVTLVDKDVVHNDFGELKPTSISGFVYHDVNDNGQLENGEDRISGVSMTLSGTDDLGASVSKQTTTNDLGYYEFINLRPGTYNVDEAQPANYLDGKDTAGSLGGVVKNDRLESISLPQAGQSINNNFGELKPARVSGYVYEDVNNNGLKEAGEAPIANTTITLVMSDGTTKTASTNADGYYEFTGLRPGIFVIRESQPADFADGKDTIGTQGGNTANDEFSNVTLTSGQHGENNNFGEIRGASIEGNVYVDNSNDGSFDPGEQPIPGVTVELSGFDDNGPVSRSTVTDPTGHYKFDGLRPGTYALVEKQPANYADGKDTIGTPGGNTANDTFTNIQLAAGTHGVDNNFGELIPAKLSGHVYVDADDDGNRDTGELPISQVDLTLTGTDSDGTAVNLTTKTNTAGYYEFNNLKPGTYRITETQPDEYLDGKDKVGTQGGTLGNDVISSIALGMGVVGEDNDFGEKSNRPADVGIVKTASEAVHKPGAIFTYNLAVTNYGQFTARGVEVTDTLPAGVTFISSSNRSGWKVTESNGVVTAKIGGIAVGVTTNITLTVKAPTKAGSITNPVEVTTKTPDNNPTNNKSKVTTRVETPGGIDSQGDPRPRFAPFINKAQAIDGGFWKYLGQTEFETTAFLNTASFDMTAQGPQREKAYADLFAIVKGSKTREAVATEVVKSDDHRIQQAKEIYQTFLGRKGTDAEVSAAAAKIKAAGSTTDVLVDILASQEYSAKYSGKAKLAAQLHMDVTGQAASASAQQQLAQAMDSRPLRAIVQDMVRSQAAIRNSVQNTYQDLLGRKASSAEVSNYSAKINAGTMTEDALAIKILASEEYFRRAVQNFKV